jgi:hypothetical protein
VSAGGVRALPTKAVTKIIHCVTKRSKPSITS